MAPQNGKKHSLFIEKNGETSADLPGYCAPTFTLMPVGSTSRRSVQVSGFTDIGRLTQSRRLVSASCSSGQRFAFGFLQISSRPEHPCRSANSSLVGRVENFHLQVSAPCRVPLKRPPSVMEGGLSRAKRSNGVCHHRI